MSRIDEQIAKQTRTKMWFTMPLIVTISIAVMLCIVFILVSKAYRFNVSPEQATPAVFNTKQGIGFFIGEKYYTMSSGVVVEVSAPKYKSQTVTLDDMQSNINVTLVPMPATVKVMTTPRVEDVVWSINNIMSGRGEILETELSPGIYLIKAQSPYFKPVSIEIDVKVADVIEHVLPFDDIEGDIVIDSEPTGAVIKVDGEDKGKTPLRVSVSGGQYNIELAYEGYNVVLDRLEVTNKNTTVERNYKMTPLQARVNTSLNPSGGTLLINGRPVTSPFNVDADKDHVLSYSKEGYISKTKTIRLNPGQVHNAGFNLQPEMGEVVFDANEPVTVLVDGKMIGTTPVRETFQTISKKVSFSRAGFRTMTKTFKTNPATLTNVKVTMLTEYDARRAEGQPLFISQMGIDMTPVQGGSFTMGSEPSVPHRKRHEHRLKVSFSKPFLLSTKEITEAQFARFKAGTPVTDMPVSNVTWEEAIAFCNWLSEQEGLPPFYDIATGMGNEGSLGYRLPTEAEWEYAASKHLQYASLKYFWGVNDRIPKEQGNFADESRSGQQTFILKGYDDKFSGKAPVGSFKTRSKLFDMDGNVSEWVHDNYNVSIPDLTRTYTDYLGPANGAGHVVKGGSFKTGRIQNLRNAHRVQLTGAQEDVGFRIARYEEN